MSKRRLLAAIVARPTGTVVACLGFAITGAFVLGAQNAIPGWFRHWLGFYLAFGLPIVYLVEIVTLGLHRLNDRSDQPGFLGTVLTAAVLGGILVSAAWGILFGASFALMTLPSGIIGGAAAGVLYWLIGIRASHDAPAV